MKIRSQKYKPLYKTEPENGDKNYQSGKLDFNNVDPHELNLMLKYGKPGNVIGQYQSKPFIELPYGIVKKDLPAYKRKI